MLYSYLSVLEQEAIHEFYLPTADVTEPELLDYREYITKLLPSLPHQAGKAYARLLSIYQFAQKPDGKTMPVLSPQAAPVIADGKRRIRVRSIKHPQTDLKRLARILIDLES